MNMFRFIGTQLIIIAAMLGICSYIGAILLAPDARAASPEWDTAWEQDKVADLRLSGVNGGIGSSPQIKQDGINAWHGAVLRNERLLLVTKDLLRSRSVAARLASNRVTGVAMFPYY
jgi:hypothetical protein